MILKVQKPLSWSPGHPPTVLIYNRDRSVFFEEPYDAGWEKFFGPDLKAYVEAHVAQSPGVGARVVGAKRVTNQPW